MPVIPLLPIFHNFNKLYFHDSLSQDFQPIVKVRWSDNRLKTTAGFYKRTRVHGIMDSEIVLSKPVLSNLPLENIKSTLCHEMIHAWVDRVLQIDEIHGPNFVRKMDEINSNQNIFKISIRHNYPVNRKSIKYKGKCSFCGAEFLYRKRVKNIACKKCCDLFFDGRWNKKCLLIFNEL